MSPRTLSFVLRSRASIFKPRQPQLLHRVSCPNPGQTRSYAPNHSSSSSFPPPSQNDLLNTKLRTLINAIPPSQKIRYVKDSSPSSTTHPTASPSLLSALLNPSPPPYTIGTDICHIPRILLLLQRQLAELGYVEGEMPRFWTRVLTPLEARYSGWNSGGGVEGRARFIAGRWAVKEAVIKAVAAAYPGGGKVFMHDIVILNAKVQSALLEAHKAAARIEAREGGGAAREEMLGGEGEGEVKGGAPRAFVKVPGGEGWVEVSVSISHDGEYATATALVPVDQKIAAGLRREKSLVRGVVAKTYTDARYL
ncbi:hypothetical protein VF21_09460 [Pseudogymnoascus sp. 05NY08]|nr:hypothetical protein VF21_09460 [Pseudogymnoascus sp. 05NY08]